MRPCPAEDVGHFVPVVYLLEVEMLDGRSGDDHAVELLVAHRLEVAIESLHVLDGRVLARMRLDLHEVYFELQRAVGEQADEVCLGRYLQRHEVEDSDSQRPNVLSIGTLVAQHKDVLISEELYGRQFKVQRRVHRC